MKLKKVLAISLSLCMLFGMSLDSMASSPNPGSTPISVPDNNIYAVTFDGDLDVQEAGYAVSVVNNSSSNEATAQAVINGDVKLSNANDSNPIDAYAVEAVSEDSQSNVYVMVEGDVRSYSDKRNSFAVWTVNDGGEIDVWVEGNVNSDSTECSATGIHSRGNDEGKTNFYINGSVGAYSTNANASAVDIFADTEAHIEGNVSANGDNSTGVAVYGGETEVYINGGIFAYAHGTDEWNNAIGLVVESDRNDVYVNVGESIHAESESGKSGAILVNAGAKDIFVEANADVVSDDTGIEYRCYDKNGKTDIIIDGTLDAEGNAVTLSGAKKKAGDEPDFSNFNLYVWKINLDKKENIASMLDVEASKNSGKHVYAPVRDFELNNIHYIIDADGGYDDGWYSVTKEDGSALDQKEGRLVAKEGAKLLIKPNNSSELCITGLYDFEGNELPLSIDENGNYYVIVKKGGGVYLCPIFDYNADYYSALEYGIDPTLPKGEILRRMEVIDTVRILDKVASDKPAKFVCTQKSLDEDIVKVLMERKSATTIYCSINDIYGSITIPAGADLTKMQGYGGVVSIKALSDAFGFTPVKD